MRLTCPRCGAQYEIPEAVIPAGGREVECSACSNVWHQPAPTGAALHGEIAAKSPDRAQVAAAPLATVLPPAEPPKLNRQLDDDVLAILREEAARELSARAREAKGTPEKDHNSVNAPANAGPGAQDGAAPAADDMGFDWPVSTVILPGEPLNAPLPATPQTTGAVLSEAAPAPGPQPVAELPATPSQPLAHAVPEPIGEPVASITDPEPAQQPGPQVTPQLAAEEPAAEEPNAEESTARPAEPPPRPRLPDAARLAATLTRPLPQAVPHAPTTPELTETQAATASTRPLQLPALRAPTTRGGYAAGFGLAAMLALALVASYALAPRVEPGVAAGPMAEWRQNLDRARLWLHDLVRGAPEA